ncbi:MAG: hypothetical protein WCP06_12895, partial [Verrucomicrobiota bacterium]
MDEWLIREPKLAGRIVPPSRSFVKYNLAGTRAQDGKVTEFRLLSQRQRRDPIPALYVAFHAH